MARGMKRYLSQRLPATFKIQITSLVDVFVILLVFLLKSYTTSPVVISQSNELSLPPSTSIVDPQDVLKLVVAQNGIFVDDKEVIPMQEGKLNPAEMDSNDPSYLANLFKALDDQAQRMKDIAKVNETVEFDGKIMVQADRRLPYELIQKVMYTSMLAGYSKVTLAVTTK